MFTRYTRNSVTVIAFLLTSFSFSVQSAEFSGGSGGVYVSGLPANFSSIRVSGPGDFFIDTSTTLIESTDGVLLDGQYSFEVSAVSAEQVGVRSSSQNNGRSEGATRQQPIVVVESGGFRISNGQIAGSRLEEEEQ